MRNYALIVHVPDEQAVTEAQLHGEYGRIAWWAYHGIAEYTNVHCYMHMHILYAHVHAHNMYITYIT